MVVSKADKESVMAFQDLLLQFGAITSLEANQLKSALYIGGRSMQLKSELTELMGFPLGSMPFRYLGSPLSAKRLTISQY